MLFDSIEPDVAAQSCLHLSEMQVLVLVLSWQTPCPVLLVQSIAAFPPHVDIVNDQQDSKNLCRTGELDPVIRVSRLSVMSNKSTNAVT